jgi:hypothetical protein
MCQQARRRRSKSAFLLPEETVNPVTAMGEKSLCILQAPCLRSRSAIELCFPVPHNCRLGLGLQRIARQEFFPISAATPSLKIQNPSNSVHDGSAIDIRPKLPTLHRHEILSRHRAAIWMSERPRARWRENEYTRRYDVMFLRSVGQFIPHAGLSSFRRTSYMLRHKPAFALVKSEPS